MSPEARTLPGFALLASGADFSCLVLQALLRRNCRPELLVLPGYAPVPKPDSVIEAVAPDDPGRHLLRIAGDVEVGYAPQSRQREAAEMIAARAIDFLLVACWPYLIETGLAQSAARAALNLHPSLLPKFRGPNPLRDQLATLDRRFGVSLHLLDQRFDHGDIVAQAELADPGEDVDRRSLEWRCAELGALLFIDALGAWPEWQPVAQAKL